MMSLSSKVCQSLNLCLKRVYESIQPTLMAKYTEDLVPYVLENVTMSRNWRSTFDRWGCMRLQSTAPSAQHPRESSGLTAWRVVEPVQLPIDGAFRPTVSLMGFCTHLAVGCHRLVVCL